MTNEERDRAIDFVIESLAGLTVSGQKQEARLDKLIESHQRAEHRLDRTERILKLMVRAGRRERRTRSEADERLNSALAELAQVQKQTEASIQHTDRRLDALIEIVRQRMNGG